MPLTVALIAFILATLAAGAAIAAPTTAQQIPIQGVVRDTGGNPLPSGDVAVRIYADSIGGSPLYDSGSEFAGAIAQGVFDIMVGGAAPLLLDNEQKYFLELDTGGAAVIGGAGRWRFHPGGGSHARGDLEARLERLESEVGSWSVERPAEVQAIGAAPTRATSSFSSMHALLGIGRFAGSGPGYSALGSLVLQPIGPHAAGAVQALLGPYYLPAPAGQVGVDDEQPPPTQFALHAARPNPFRHRVELAYDLPAPSPVHFGIYDLHGRRVRTVLAGTVQEAGRHRFQWDARDDDGRRASAGVYLYRLRAGTWSAAGRIALLP